MSDPMYEVPLSRLNALMTERDAARAERDALAERVERLREALKHASGYTLSAYGTGRFSMVVASNALRADDEAAGR